MNEQERASVTAELTASRLEFWEAVKDLSTAQWEYACNADGWSIANCAEHVIRVERGVLRQLKQLITVPTLNASVSPTLEEIAHRDFLASRGVASRRTRVAAPPFALPKGKYKSSAEALADFESGRQTALEFAATTQGDLRGVSAEHPFLGPIDGVQWLLMIANHGRRHIKQIEEIKRSEGYPAS